MCECLAYSDGTMHLCEVCGPFFMDDIKPLKDCIEAADAMRQAIAFCKFYGTCAPDPSCGDRLSGYEIECDVCRRVRTYDAARAALENK